MMPHAIEDNWDQHWTDISAATEQGPSPKFRTRLILKLLNITPDQQGVRLLDIGSGLGDFVHAFQEGYPLAKVVGLEISRRGIEIASAKCPSALFLQCDLLDRSSRGQLPRLQATHAVCSEVLEHLDYPEKLLTNVTPCLGPGCKLVITVPGGPMSAFYRHIGHRRHYSPRDLKDLLLRTGYQVDQVYGAGFPFFNIFRLLLTLRGKKLIEDVSRPSAAETPLHVRAGNVLFDRLFRFDLMFWGWQTIAVARWPG